MEQEQRQQIKKYVALFLRRKELIIGCIMLAIVVGVAVYIVLPKKYQSTALLIYKQQTINQPKQSLDVNARTIEMVSTLSQQVLSRSNLETIIKQHSLYTNALSTLPMQDVVESMRKDIQITTSKEGNTFQISFTGSAPRKVMLVTNALAARFIEENLRFRYEKASETSSYTQDELEMSKKSLNKKESLMRDYKLKHYNEMPQQLEFNIVRLNFLQTQLQNNDQASRELDQTRLIIQEQIGNLNDEIQPGLPLSQSGSTQQALAELTATQSTLDSLRLKYTDNHPEIKKLLKLQETQQQNYDELLAAPLEPKKQIVPLPTNYPVSRREQQLQQLTLQLKEVSYNINNLKTSRGKVVAEIEKYTKWINATPVREAEWTSLTRNYEQLNNHYQQLVADNLNAKGVEELERRQKGSQFKIVDSAHFPEKPHTPKFLKIILAALAAGAGLGGGITILLDLMDTTFKNALDLESKLGIPVIASIPQIQLERERKIATLKSIAWGITGLICSIAITMGTIYLWRKGLIII